MARYPKMTESISVAEMLHMRNEEHMTNRQIADRLGCGMNTVRKYIGNQPEDMPRGRGAAKKNLPSLPAKEIPEMPRESFKERCERVLGDPATENIQEALKTPEDTRKSLFAEALEAEREELKKTAKKAIEDTFSILPETKKFVEELPILKMPQPGQVEEVASLPLEPTVGDIMREHGIPVPEPKTVKLSDCIDEMRLVFGGMAVEDYLRCRLYELGMHNTSAVIIDRDGLVEKLQEMRGRVLCDR